MTKRLFFIVFSLGLLAVSKSDASAEPPPAPGRSYALIVGGLASQKPYDRWYADWTSRFQTYLTKTARVPAENITLLAGDAATTDAVLASIGKFAQRAKPQDQFILFIVGHGEVSGQTPTLALPGPDLAAQQLAAALNAVPAGNQVVLNFSASSGDFLKQLVSPDRVNLTATSPAEINTPVFAEFFLRGLESNRADTDKNGTVTLLEAYNWAAQQTAMWINRLQKTGPDGDSDSPVTTWRAVGKETVEIFRKLYADAPSRKLDPSSDDKAEDAVVEVIPPNGEITEAWINRRIVDEHALLEDCGQEIGVSVINDKGIQPILGAKPKDPGYLAAHTILGQPANHP